MSDDDVTSERETSEETESDDSGGEFDPIVTASDGETNVPEGDREAMTREQRLDRKRDRLEQRELGLDKRAEDLNQRETDLDERAATLDERKRELDVPDTTLDERETRIAAHEEELDERESTLEERAEQLKDRAAELDRKEQTLHEYVDDQLGDIEDSIGKTVQESVSNALIHYNSDSSRLGTTGRLLVGLAGIALVAGGVANAVAGVADYTTLLNSTSANFAVSAVLLLVGLGATLGAVTTRV